jgi:hypothetical protein
MIVMFVVILVAAALAVVVGNHRIIEDETKFSIHERKKLPPID